MTLSAFDTPKRKRVDDRLIGLGFVLFAVLALAAAWWFISNSDGQPVKVERVIQEITVIEPPPPVEPEPEEKIMEEEPEIIEPEDTPIDDKPVEQPTPDEAPAASSEPSPTPTAAPAGLDRAADSGSDSFRLAAGGGGGLYGGGSGRFGRGGGGLGGWRNTVEAHVRRALQRDPRTKAANGSVNVNISIAESGTINGAQLLSSSGDAKLDAAIREVLANLPPLSQRRPDNVGASTYATINLKRPGG